MGDTIFTITVRKLANEQYSATLTVVEGDELRKQTFTEDLVGWAVEKAVAAYTQWAASRSGK